MGHSIYEAYVIGDILMFDRKKITQQLVFVAYLTLYMYLYYKLSLSDGLLFTTASRKNAIMMITNPMMSFNLA